MTTKIAVRTRTIVECITVELPDDFDISRYNEGDGAGTDEINDAIVSAIEQGRSWDELDTKTTGTPEILDVEDICA